MIVNQSSTVPIFVATALFLLLAFTVSAVLIDDDKPAAVETIVVRAPVKKVEFKVKPIDASLERTNAKNWVDSIRTTEFLATLEKPQHDIVWSHAWYFASDDNDEEMLEILAAAAVEHNVYGLAFHAAILKELNDFPTSAETIVPNNKIRFALAAIGDREILQDDVARWLEHPDEQNFNAALRVLTGEEVSDYEKYLLRRYTKRTGKLTTYFCENHKGPGPCADIDRRVRTVESVLAD